jgi:hypothetical protein
MAVAMFPIDKWRPGNYVAIYQVVWRHGSVHYYNLAGDVLAID